MDQRALEVLARVVEGVVVRHERQAGPGDARGVEIVADLLRGLEGGVALRVLP